MKKFAFLTFMPLGFAALASLSNASPLSVSKHIHSHGDGLNETHPNADYIDAYVVKTEVELPAQGSGNVYLTITGDSDLASGAANQTVFHLDDAEVNFLDYMIITAKGVDYSLREAIDEAQPVRYNLWTRGSSFCFHIKRNITELYTADRTGGKFSNTSHITIKEGFTIPAYSYGSVETSTEPAYLKTPATSVFSDPRDSGVSVVYKVDEEIDLTYCEEQTDAGRISNYRSVAGLQATDPVTGIVFGSDQSKTPRDRKAENANVATSGLINGILNGHKIKINGKHILGERSDRIEDAHSYLNLDYWTQWWKYELFVNGGEEDGIQTIEVKEGTVFPCYKTKNIGSYVTASDTVETITNNKTRLVYRVKEDAKFVKNSKGNFIRDHGEDYETSVKDGKVKFLPWDAGTRFLQFNLTNSDYQDYTFANQAVDSNLADKYEFVDHIEYYDEGGNLVSHNGSANDTLINYFPDPGKTEGNYDIGIRVKQDGVTQDPFTNVKYIKFKAGMQFPSYCYMAIYTNDPNDPIPAPEFAWSRPDMSAYTLTQDLIFYATGKNNEFVRLVDRVTDVEEASIPAGDLILNVGRHKPDATGDAVKNFDQTADTLHFVEGDPSKQDDTYGLYFSHTPTDAPDVDVASEVRFYLPGNAYKDEKKDYPIKGWSFDYKLTDINSTKKSPACSTYIGTNYEDGAESTKPLSETTSYMVQYLASLGTKYYGYDINLTADGEWHTCTINQYCPNVDGLNIKLFGFNGEFVVANVKCDIDTHVDTLGLVEGKDPTCVADGWKDCYRCSLCGKYFTDNTATTEIADYESWKTGDGKLSATGEHTTTKIDGKAPTCVKDGWKDYYQCSVCLAFFEDEAATKPIADLETWKTGDGKLSATGEHTTTKIDGKAPTCVADGWKDYYQCSVCKAYFEDQAATKPIADLEIWKTGDGKIPAAGHDIELAEARVEPTCEDAGHKAYYVCSTCGAYFEDTYGNTPITDLTTWLAVGGGGYLEPTGHHPTKTAKLDPTCTVAGHEEYWYCASCGIYYEDEACEIVIGDVADLNIWKSEGGDGYLAPHHTLEEVSGKSATCTEAGYKACYHCTVCDKYFVDEVCSAEIQDYTAWISEGGDGYIAPTGHNTVKVDGKAATCTEAGYKDCYKCTVCGEYFEDEACTKPIADYEAWKTGAGKIEALGHDYKFVAEVAATKDKEGMKEHYECTRCGKLFVKEGDNYKEVTAADLVIPKKKGGCGGSIIAGGSVALVAALGATALLVVKKKKEKKD